MTLANLFKSLSEPVRLRILSLLLTQDELCVCEIVDSLELSQSVISRHLAYLRHNNLVLATREGAWMYYQINPNPIINMNHLFQFIQHSCLNNNEIKADYSRLIKNKIEKNQCTD
jgi:ArsR family transcriptional regulator